MPELTGIWSLSRLPTFKTEQEEREFWEQNDSSECVDWNKAKLASMPNLKPSTKTVEIRNETRRKARLCQAFQELADSNVVERFGDPLEWQRKMRADRPLPGRD